MGMSRILIAVDFSQCGQKALEAGIGLAMDLKSPVRLVHAFRPNPSAPLMAGLGYEEMFEQLAADIETDEALELSKWARKARAAGLDVQTEARPGREAEVILESAKAKDVSMIVVGTHGRSGFRKLLVGSVAQEVLQRTRKPVLVVPYHPPK